MRSRRRGELEAVGRWVPRVLADLGLEAPLQVLRLAPHWEAAVGPEAALHSRPASLRQGVLEVEVDSSVWAQQLQLSAPEILAALAAALGDAEAPTSLRTRLR